MNISYKQRIFRIVADNADHPYRKVLEMSESDGMKSLKQHFGNSLEQMLESIWISDKIYIRGLERSQTDSIRNISTKNFTSRNNLSPIRHSSSQAEIKQSSIENLEKTEKNILKTIEQPNLKSIEESTSNIISKLQSNNSKPYSGNKQDQQKLSKADVIIKSNIYPNKTEQHRTNIQLLTEGEGDGDGDGGRVIDVASYINNNRNYKLKQNNTNGEESEDDIKEDKDDNNDNDSDKINQIIQQGQGQEDKKQNLSNSLDI